MSTTQVFKNPRAKHGFQGRTCSIISVGSYVPERILTNAELEKMVETTDEWITTRVHQRFVDEDLLKGSDISVDTDHHVVTLKGTVTARAGRARAGAVALKTEGVQRVVNRLTIGTKPKA